MEKLTDDYERWFPPQKLGLIDAMPDDMTYAAIHIYVSFIGRGLLPPDNILLIIGKCFDSYLKSKGNKTLDRAFGMQVSPGIGHPLSHRKAYAWKQYATFLIWHRRKAAKDKGHKIPSVVTVARGLIEEYKIPHPKTPGEYYNADTLEREYKDAKSNAAPELWGWMAESSPDLIGQILETADYVLKGIR